MWIQINTISHMILHRECATKKLCRFLPHPFTSHSISTNLSGQGHPGLHHDVPPSPLPQPWDSGRPAGPRHSQAAASLPSCPSAPHLLFQLPPVGSSLDENTWICRKFPTHSLEVQSNLWYIGTQPSQSTLQGILCDTEALGDSLQNSGTSLDKLQVPLKEAFQTYTEN